MSNEQQSAEDRLSQNPLEGLPEPEEVKTCTNPYCARQFRGARQIEEGFDRDRTKLDGYQTRCKRCRRIDSARAYKKLRRPGAGRNLDEGILGALQEQLEPYSQMMEARLESKLADRMSQLINKRLQDAVDELIQTSKDVREGQIPY